MHRSRNNRALVSLLNRGIDLSYSKAIAPNHQYYQLIVAFIKAQIVKDIDYGVIPGTKKPTLLNLGAEKLLRLFNLRPHIKLIHSVVDFDMTCSAPYSGTAHLATSNIVGGAE